MLVSLCQTAQVTPPVHSGALGRCVHEPSELSDMKRSLLGSDLLTPQTHSSTRPRSTTCSSFCSTVTVWWLKNKKKGSQNVWAPKPVLVQSFNGLCTKHLHWFNTRIHHQISVYCLNSHSVKSLSVPAVPLWKSSTMAFKLKRFPFCCKRLQSCFQIVITAESSGCSLFFLQDRSLQCWVMQERRWILQIV